MTVNWGSAHSTAVTFLLVTVEAGRVTNQIRADGVSLDVANDPIQFRFIPYAMMEAQ